uniref:Uncharacterized protein n=1 Tax=Eucampia antarctica TaxID=49252 RepID=A0A7S2WHI5_9STRA|mmetsp:Transcript_2990/g.2878  ORF Transcript_2990/g.2878 Transcript_2990/m.2878 type:complete len:120 (+) Transcript_2990:61-420(+)
MSGRPKGRSHKRKRLKNFGAYAFIGSCASGRNIDKDINYLVSPTTIDANKATDDNDALTLANNAIRNMSIDRELVHLNKNERTYNILTASNILETRLVILTHLKICFRTMSFVKFVAVM